MEFAGVLTSGLPVFFLLIENILLFTMELNPIINLSNVECHKGQF